MCQDMILIVKLSTLWTIYIKMVSKVPNLITLFWLFHFKVLYINDMTVVLYKGIAKEAYVWKI